MLSRKTGIGLGVGAAITAIGVYALVSSIGLQAIQVNDTYGVGETTTYRFEAPEHAKQFLNITGDAFQLTLSSPRGGLQIEEENFKDELSLEWTHLRDGVSKVDLQNTGDSELQVRGTLQFLTEPIQITYHILVIIAGLVIVGFSSAFSVRKPRGF